MTLKLPSQSSIDATQIREKFALCVTSFAFQRSFAVEYGCFLESTLGCKTCFAKCKFSRNCTTSNKSNNNRDNTDMIEWCKSE